MVTKRKDTRPHSSRRPKLPEFDDTPGAELVPEGGDGDGERDGSQLFTIRVRNGRIVWPNVTPKKKRRLHRMVTDPEFASQIGIAAEPAGPGAEPAARAVTPEACALLYQTLSQVFVGLARLRGVAPEHAAILAFTEQETEALAPATAKVLAKYVGPFKYEDELILIVALSTVMAGKAAHFREAVAKSAGSGRTPAAAAARSAESEAS